ncbi:Uncharacterized protein Adt_18535 [Abeliophyllum distichum]|uniref:Retrotransposon gag domain-containing protein n=1 Tax=Abeliophyllum distichum TaxID=126358 RepID=A0ABD1TJM7_9LAMI
MGSSISLPLLVPTRRSEHGESCLEGGRDPMFINTRFKDEKPELKCDLDDDDKNLSFSIELNATETKLHGNIPIVKCRNFHTILTSDAKRWYNNLKLGSIRSWPQLKREFINTFIDNWTMIADIAQLFDIL